MAVIYRYNRAKLTDGLRLEAEFYQPKYLFEVSPHCKWTKIGSILTFCQYGSSLPLNEDGKGYPIFRLNEINDCFLTKPQKWVVMSQREYQMLKLQRDDVLFCRTNGNFELVGRTGILKEDIDAVFASYLVRVRTNPQYILPEFLTIYLNTTFGKLQIQRRAMRSNQVNVSASQLRAIPIPIFAHEFQEKVADFVNHAADKIVLSKHNYAQAEQLLLSELGLLDWKPRRTLTYVRSFNQVAKASRMDAEHFHPKYKELRDIIRNYSGGYLRLIDIAVNSNETIEPRTNPEHNFKYIELADIDQNIGVIENAKTIKGKNAPSRARMLLRNGDVIASSVEGSLDKVALVSEEYDGAIGSTGFFVLRPRTVSSGYLLALIKSMIVREQMHCESSGTILAAVPAKSLKNIIVPNIQQEIQDAISALVQQSHAARREAKTLLEKAKRAVEIAIEYGEQQAIDFLCK